MDTLSWIILATLVDGLVALVGVFTLGMRKKLFDMLVFLLVAFSAGALLGGAFFHLLVESVDQIALNAALVYLILGFALFFVLEKVLLWRHCHEGKCDVHPFTYLILFGDGVHNFIDGLVIAASFLVSVPFGIVSTMLILSHEIPQELGDFGVLVYGGIEKRTALLYNLAAQLTCVLGGLAGYFGLQAAGGAMAPLLAFAAGGFIYIAASDLIPELHKEEEMSKAANAFAVFLVGVALMLVMKYYIGG